MKPKYLKDYPGLYAQVHPDFSSSIDFDRITYGSNVKLWWKCPEGHDHIWQASVKSRVSNGRGCPFCAGKAVSQTNSLEACNPEIAREWHPSKNGSLKPSEITRSSGKKVWWRCSEGHEYLLSVNQRVTRVRVCPYCSSYRIGQGNSLADKFPEIAAELHPTLNGDLVAEKLAPASHKRVWFICSRGHEYQTPVSSRTTGGTCCPTCNSNSTSKPELRIYSELKWLCPDAKHRYKVRRIEFDVFIPSIRLAIEYDGAYWHRDKRSGELIKNAKAEYLGITLIRIREAPLSRLTETDFLIKKSKQFTKTIMDKLLSHIFQQHLSIDLGDKLCRYFEAETFQNESLYLKEFKKYYQDDSDEGILWIQNKLNF